MNSSQFVSPCSGCYWRRPASRQTQRLGGRVWSIAPPVSSEQELKCSHGVAGGGWGVPSEGGMECTMWPGIARGFLCVPTEIVINAVIIDLFKQSLHLVSIIIGFLWYAYKYIWYIYSLRWLFLCWMEEGFQRNRGFKVLLWRWSRQLVCVLCLLTLISLASQKYVIIIMS